MVCAQSGHYAGYYGLYDIEMNRADNINIPNPGPVIPSKPCIHGSTGFLNSADYIPSRPTRNHNSYVYTLHTQVTWDLIAGQRFGLRPSCCESAKYLSSTGHTTRLL